MGVGGVGWSFMQIFYFFLTVYMWGANFLFQKSNFFNLLCLKQFFLLPSIFNKKLEILFKTKKFHSIANSRILVFS